ncbi:ABC transporter ATP-binding protein [Cylindrospermum sp. FACHB-282]|uniref:ABC transporter ATP-binding protein n=1 Tax=Cylindrospermum sp. FACHB-282 TaxID=2692794 RepID=UPI00168604D7|nr:ABC transporter ATP-binding protein [Cylindrospermum sp. FACHB-282]MBD2387214.1 ABC transporter ATP-binding protein [Cylindrospermum sp. FACHB-282]
MKELQAIKALMPLIKFYPWAIPVIVLLGTLSPFAEGLGISLFIPLLQSLDKTSAQTSVYNNLFLNYLNQLFLFIHPSQRFLIIPFFIFLAFLLKSGLSYGYQALSHWLYVNVYHHLRVGIFQQLLNVSQSFIDSHQSGRLINTLEMETSLACDALTYFTYIIIHGCTITVFILLLLLLSWQITIFVAVSLVCISIIIRKLTYQISALGEQKTNANSDLYNRIVEGIIGIKVIRSFGQESYEKARFDDLSKNVRNVSVKFELLSSAVEPISEVFSVAILVAILIIAFQNQATVPVLLTFILMLSRLQPYIKEFDKNRAKLVGLLSPVNNVVSFLDTSNKPYIYSGKAPFKKLELAISFEDVIFCYESQTSPAVEGISICIPKGKTTAFVGPSGSGKSTLINLLLRFYEVTQGEIYLDGSPLRNFNLSSWRSQIALVSQDVHMFSTTIKENIAYSRLDASDEEVIAAAKQAYAHEFICNLPQGYDTHIGDRGVRLSGGQRQRISIARAILRNPQILILDEATNALDSESERLIQEAVNILSQNRTVIVIAHRLSTIEKSDQIIVLDHGRVVEQGKFSDLLKLKGMFSKLYQLQHSGTLL